MACLSLPHSFFQFKKNICMEGKAGSKGTKYVLRSDIMFQVV